MSLNHFAVPHYRVNRSSAKISELPGLEAIDPAAKFIVAHNGRNFSVTGSTLITVISNAVIALGGGVDSFDPLGLPVSTATQQALNGKANTNHTHEISHVNGLAVYVTNAINVALAGLSYAALNHTHAIADVVGLQTALSAKALASDIPPILEALANLTTDKANVSTVTQIQTSIANLVTLINQKASQTDLTALTNVVNGLIQTVNNLSPTAHSHQISDVTGLATELAQYAAAIGTLVETVTTIEGNYVVSGVTQW